MANSADLIVNIVTKLSGTGMQDAGKQTSKFKSGLNKASVVAGAALAGIVGFGAGAVKAASDVQQSLGAVDAVFGKNATQVKKWADSSATSLGLSKNAYMELATVTGAQLKNMGLPMDQVTGKTNALIQKGADLAATFGGTTKDAVEAIGAALRGETDPIERYGVSIKQADIAAQQAAEGTSKLTGAAGKQAKTMALLHLMNKQTADSTGAFARESDTAAHQSQVASAQYEDLQAALGEALLPAVTLLTSKLAGLARMMAKHKTTTQIVIVAIAAMAVAVIALNVAVTIYTAVTTLAGSATVAAWVAALWPILLVIAAVAAVVVVVVLLWKKSQTFRTIVLAVWGAIRAGAAATGRALVAMWNAVAAGARRFAAVVRSVWSGVQAAARAVSTTVRTIWRLVWLAVSLYVRAYLAVIRAVFGVIKSVASSTVGWLKDKWQTLWSSVGDLARTFQTKVEAVWSAIQSGASKVSAPFDAIRRAIESVISAVENLIGALGRIHVPKISLPHIPGLSSVTRAVATPDVAGLAARSAAPAVAAPRASSGGQSASGTTIIVNGAIDPEATARQIERILSGHGRRVGLRVA